MPSTPISPLKRAGILFFNFFLIILAYYHIKPASRSLFIEYLGADRLPYVWIGTAVTLFALIGAYHRIVARYSRLAVVLGTCLTSIAALVGFRVLLADAGPVSAVGFYIFADIFSVVLVEQFWSLTNTIYSTREGKRWYGLVGTGGLVGGALGGGMAALLLRHTPLATEDLLLVAAAIIAVIVAVTVVMGRLGVYGETPGAVAQVAQEERAAASAGWRALASSRYLLVIAAILLLAQLVEPVVEFQFSKAIEAAYTDKDRRTEYLSAFFLALSLASIAVNLAVTPLVHRYLGVIPGLMTQPLMVSVASFGFMSQPAIFAASVMKISDRGLSYSINRASKELLYVPIDPVAVYQAKAWIDMFGYRVFKVVGSVLILALTQWLPLGIDTAGLSWLTLAVCAAWIAAILSITRDYRELSAVPAPQRG